MIEINKCIVTLLDHCRVSAVGFKSRSTEACIGEVFRSSGGIVPRNADLAGQGGPLHGPQTTAAPYPYQGPLFIMVLN